MRRILFYLLAALPLLGHAAGFDCAKAGTPTERAICADAALSRQDDELTRLWQAHTGDASALPAQRAWIKQRNACGGDLACLRQSYRQRLLALHAAPDNTADTPPRFQQAWRLDSPNESVGSKLAISGTRPLHFSLQGWNGGNIGTLEGEAIQDGHSHARYAKDGCQLDFYLRSEKLVVAEKTDEYAGGCGAGVGVDYSGNYVSAAQHGNQAKPDLLSLGVVSTPAENVAMQQLLGKDYGKLLDDVNVQIDGTDQDGLGAQVREYFVRGIANTNAAIVMRKDRQLWIGLLVFDARNNSRMRYYSNAPAWKKRVPKTIQAWHDDHDKSLPIDLMP